MNSIPGNDIYHGSDIFLHLHQVQTLFIALGVVVLLYLVSRLVLRPHGGALPRPDDQTDRRRPQVAEPSTWRGRGPTAPQPPGANHAGPVDPAGLARSNARR